VHGPVDFLLLDFPDDRLTGRAAEELLTLAGLVVYENTWAKPFDAAALHPAAS
jgi:hypothetical protein